jgi:uncharacterized protein (DUF2141 family)
MRWGLVLALMAPWAAHGAEVRVTVTGVRNGRGHVLVALCGEADFLKPHCPWQARAPAQPGAVQVLLAGVPPGIYAAEAFHDENDNGALDRNFFGMPEEGMGFSNDAPMRFGPPRFSAAAVVVPKDGAELRFGLRYY